MEQLKELVAVEVKSGVSAAVDANLKGYKEETNKLLEKQLFSVQEGPISNGFRKTILGSEMNTSGLFKALGATMQSKNNVSDSDLVGTVLGNGGIFTKLSPAMEKFALLLKSGFNLQRAAVMGFDLKEYNGMIGEQHKAMGWKAATAANENTAAAGGILVPVEYSAVVIEFAIQMSNILSKLWRIPMTSATAKWPRLAQTDDSFFGGMTFNWVGEGVSVQNKQKAAWEQLTFTAHKVAAELVLTNELIQDSIINVINYVTAVGTRAWMYELERCVLDGAGVYQPLGISNDPIVIANGVSRQTANTVSYVDLVNVEAEMNENFRNLEWVMRRKTMTKLRAEKDTVGQPVYHEQFALFNDTPTWQKTIIGYPIEITRNARAMGHAFDVTLADLSYYMLATRKDMTIDMSPYPYWATDETAIRFIARVDGKCGSPYAFKGLKGTGS
jgi:HK97 family phage major capsid protein